MSNQWPKYLLIASISASSLLIAQTGKADPGAETAPTPEQIKQLLDEQTRKLAEAKRKLAEQDAQQAQTRKDLDEAARQLNQLRAQAGLPTTPASPSTSSSTAPRTNVQTASVGQTPPQNSARQPEVAQIFEQPGVLTPRGKFTLEPSLQYAYSTANRVALVGYTIIPALLIGLVDVQEVKRTTEVATLTGRYGLTNRFEIEAKIPYVHRSDDYVGRQLDPATETVFSPSGSGLGDIEATLRYQFNDGGADSAYYIGSLRLKSRTGKDPFESKITQQVTGFTSGISTELPTGSGFYGIQPGLTMLYPSDPVVFFGSLSYLYSFERNHVKQKTDTGDIDLGSVQAGGVYDFNFGIGLGLNERSSFSIGYEQSMVEKTKVDGHTIPNTVVVQLSTLLLGFSYKLDDVKTLNFSVAAGLTADTPDITLTFRMPMTF